MWLTLLARFWYIPVMAVMAFGVHHYRTELQVTQAQYEAFQAKTEALGEQAKAHKAEVEAQNAKVLNDAVSSRNAALASLRLAEANSRSRPVPGPVAAPAGSRQVCFDSTAYNAAHAEFLKRLAGSIQTAIGLATEGDAAQIDAKALIGAWPK